MAGQVLKKLLSTYPDKVHGQEVVAGRKASLLYDALDAYPEAYKVVPDKSVRSRMNICFRVIKVHFSKTRRQLTIEQPYADWSRVAISMRPKRHF